jgi:hypothetical protein
VNPASDPGADLLPGRLYHEPTIWARGQERLFGRLWVCVGRADLLGATGRYRTVRVGDESVRVVRDEAGGFEEVCEWVQAGARSRAVAAGGAHGGIERHIRGFNDWLLDPLGLAADRPAPDSSTSRA